MLTAQNQINLPPRFADKVLELESLFEDHCSIDIITKLNQLYRIAIDYYIHNDVKKASFFQKKMKGLFNDPLTLNLIENNKSPPEKLKQISQKSKINGQISRFSLCSEQIVRVILQQSEKALKKSETLKTNNLNKQEQNLKNRILLKKSKSNQKLVKMRLNANTQMPSK